MMEHHYYYYYCTPQKSLVGSCRATCTSLAWSCTNYLYYEGQEMDTELKYTKLKEGSSMKTDGTRQASLSVIGDAPKRPEDPHQGVGEHKKECDDWCRPTLFGHEYHWSELLILLLLATVVILAIINSFIEGETKSLQPEHYWMESVYLVRLYLDKAILWLIL